MVKKMEEDEFLDKKDMAIIDYLKQNSRQSTYQISKKIGIPITTVHNRIKKLEKEGIIKQYSLVLDQKKIGNTITVYILVHYNISVWKKEADRYLLGKYLSALPNIVEIKYITGRFDILLKFYVKDMEMLNNIIMKDLRKIPGIGQTETIFVLDDIK
ncbi:Lrp/AsnC family transcriptional regulator [Candidatus Woesearchaeota archaeon]|nr:Lrp/AsnC family transcriptional regulator [Candidatus Woesearchaeota archaeon]